MRKKSTRFLLAVMGFWGHIAVLLLVLIFLPNSPSQVAVALVWASAFDVAVYIAGRTIRPARFIRGILEEKRDEENSFNNLL